MRKAVAIVKQTPELQDQFKRLDDLIGNYNDRIDFLKKKKVEIEKEFDEKKKPVWDSIRDFCKEKKFLPEDFDEKKYHFHYDEDVGLLFVCDGKDHNPLAQIIGGLVPPR